MIVESYEDVIILSGALRSNFWETVHTAISLTLKRHPTGVIVDCSGLTEATPEGVDTFRDVMKFIELHDARVIVAAVPEPIMKVLKSVEEVRSQLPIAATVEEARRSLDLLVAPEHEEKKRRRRTNGDLKKILVCLSGQGSDDYLIHVAAEVAESQPTELVLLYPVLVPRELPIQAPLPEVEEAAARSLEEAASRLEALGVHHTKRIERGRDVGTTIEDALAVVAAVQVLVALPEKPGQPGAATRLIESIMAKVSSPLLIVRGSVDRRG